ncbi:hypothetical protein V6N11_062771 [Hibiscus sabdariffa]|uniref:Uncharacterized protein n=1 Tax=Hibiscus sabdariffa TaxID=183260 RepID=A0ABR2PTJ5_9ROSI
MGSIAEKIFERSSIIMVSLRQEVSLFFLLSGLLFLPFPFRDFDYTSQVHAHKETCSQELQVERLVAPGSVGAKCAIRNCIKLAKSLGPPPSIDDWGIIPSIEQLGLESEKAR